jgi:hypothetical protein
MNVEAINLPVPVRHRRRFWRHFAEMVVVMLLSMAILGAAVSAGFALAGHANLLHFAALRGLLMTAYMVIGMALDATPASRLGADHGDERRDGGSVRGAGWPVPGWGDREGRVPRGDARADAAEHVRRDGASP